VSPADKTSTSDPNYHTTNIKKALTELIDHARRDSAQVSDPKAQALFETTAEVLAGLRKAFDDFEKRNEIAWKQAG
jgi:hypothetical protein